MDISLDLAGRRVLVFGGALAARRVLACASQRVWLSREPAASVAPLGRVTLVCGGPGDDGLLTMAAVQALRDADIVFYDKLSPHDRLEEWCPGARHVDVGKTPGHHATPQTDIERMLVESALAGLTVVRLKGGDPSATTSSSSACCASTPGSGPSNSAAGCSPSPPNRASSRRSSSAAPASTSGPPGPPGPKPPGRSITAGASSGRLRRPRARPPSRRRCRSGAASG